MTLLLNKKAHHEYEITRSFLAGVVLSGQEVKSLRLKHGSLAGSFVKIIAGEAVLIGAQINLYRFATVEEYDPKQTRKLLLKKKEIFQIQEATAQRGWSAVPVSFKLIGNRIKLEIGLGRGKREFEKRAVLKKKALQRDVDRELKQRIKLR